MTRWRITWVCRPCDVTWVVRRAPSLDAGAVCPCCGGNGEMPWEVTGLLPPPLMAVPEAPGVPAEHDDFISTTDGHLDRPPAAAVRRVIPL